MKNILTELETFASFTSKIKANRQKDMEKLFLPLFNALKSKPNGYINSVNNVKIIFSKGHLKVYSYSGNKDETAGMNHIMGVVEDGKKKDPAFSISYYFDSLGKTRKQIPRISKTDASQRYRGHSIQLIGYEYLIEEYGALLSDRMVSVGTIVSTWKKLSENKKYKVVLYNSSTQEIIDPDDLDIDIFSIGPDGLDIDMVDLEDGRGRDYDDTAYKDRMEVSVFDLTYAAFKRGKNLK